MPEIVPLGLYTCEGPIRAKKFNKLPAPFKTPLRDTCPEVGAGPGYSRTFKAIYVCFSNPRRDYGLPAHGFALPSAGASALRLNCLREFAADTCHPLLCDVGFESMVQPLLGSELFMGCVVLKVVKCKVSILWLSPLLTYTYVQYVPCACCVARFRNMILRERSRVAHGLHKRIQRRVVCMLALPFAYKSGNAVVRFADCVKFGWVLQRSRHCFYIANDLT